MGFIEAMCGLPTITRLVVGVENDPDGSLRVYVGPRYRGIHTHIDGKSSDAERVRREWAGNTLGHLFADIPAEALCDCQPGADS